MGVQRQDRFHASAGRIVYKECRHHRAHSCFEKSFAKGPGSGLRMLTYFMNRAGRGLTGKRRAELQKAKGLLSARIQREKESAARKAA